MPEYAERPEPSYSSSSSFQPRELTEEEKEAQRLERERQLEKERAERERWNALSPEEQEAERKAKKEREQASVDQEIAKYLAYQKEEAAKRAKEEQEQAKKKASQPQPVVNEPSAEERQRRTLEQETIIGVKRHYANIKKKYITSIRKRVPDIKQRFAQFEAKASQQGLEVGTQSFVAELEATFGGLKWGVMRLDDPTPKPTMTDTDGFAIVEHSEKANKVDESNTQISKSVGADGLNLKADVITIQTALLKLGLLSETAFREESTAATNTTTPSVEQEKLKETIAAIRKLQEEVLHLSDEEIDGRINGNDSKTLSEMRAERMDVDHVQNRMKDFPIIEAQRKKTKDPKEEKKEQELKPKEESNRKQDKSLINSSHQHQHKADNLDINFEQPLIDEFPSNNIKTIIPIKDFIGGTNANIGAAALGLEELANSRLKHEITKQYINSHPDLFPGGIEKHKKIFEKGIESFEFYPGKSTGNTGSGFSKVKFKTPNKMVGLANKMGQLGIIVDVGFIAYDLYQEDYGSAAKSSIVLGASLYVHPVIGPVVALYDITMAREKNNIYSQVAESAKQDYLKYKNSDYKKANRALRKYYQYGGNEAIEGRVVNASIGPKPN